jgi:hypothetical protein
MVAEVVLVVLLAVAVLMEAALNNLHLMERKVTLAVHLMAVTALLVEAEQAPLETMQHLVIQVVLVALGAAFQLLVLP